MSMYNSHELVMMTALTIPASRYVRKDRQVVDELVSRNVLRKRLETLIDEMNIKDDETGLITTNGIKGCLEILDSMDIY